MRALLLALLALPLLAEAQGFRFTGTEASAASTRSSGFVAIGDPTSTAFEEGLGSVSLSGTDRIGAASATHGDRGALAAELSTGRGRFRVVMDEVGFEGGQVRSAPWGGVAVNVPVHGGAPLGMRYAVQAHAALVVMGSGSVYRDGRLLTAQAQIYGFALTTGTHADDSSHQVIATARPGDAEIEVIAANLPPAEVPGGVLRLFYDDVAISVGGSTVPAQAFVETVPRLDPDEVVATRNFGSVTLPLSSTEVSAPIAQQPQIVPFDAAGRLDVSGGRVVGFRSFVDGEQVAAGGVDADTGTGGSGSAGTAPTADDSIRVSNANPAAPLPPTVRPANSNAAPTLPSSPSPLFANPLIPFSPGIRPSNSNPVAAATQLQPLNPNAPAIGTSVTQFPGLTPSSTNLGTAQSVTTVGLPVSTTGVGSGLAGATAADGQPAAIDVLSASPSSNSVAAIPAPVAPDGTGGSGANAFGGALAGGASAGQVGGAFSSSSTLVLPLSGVNPANIPGFEGGFAGLPVVGGAGTFPGLTPTTLGQGSGLGQPPQLNSTSVVTAPVPAVPLFTPGPTVGAPLGSPPVNNVIVR